MDRVLDRLDQVREELECAPCQYIPVVLPEIERIERKKKKILKKSRAKREV